MFISFSRLRLLIPLNLALDRLGWRPEASWCDHGGLRGGCPIHGSTDGHSRVFVARLKTRFWRCYKCGAHGDVVELWARYYGCSRRDAALILFHEFNLRPQDVRDQG